MTCLGQPLACVIGLCQALEQQRIPGNRNLSCVDPAMKPYQHMCFIEQDLHFSTENPLRAGLVTSLGFGHVSAALLLLHPGAFVSALDQEQKAAYQQKSEERRRRGNYLWEEIRMGKAQAFQRVQHRRFHAKDGSKEQSAEETAMLLNPQSRLVNGFYQSDKQ